MITHGLVTSILDGNNSLLAGCTKDVVTKLQKVQNAAARLIYQHKHVRGVTSLRKKLHWLGVRERIIYKVCVMTHKALYSESAPRYLKDLLVIRRNSRNLRQSGVQLQLPRAAPNYNEVTFKYIAPAL